MMNSVITGTGVFVPGVIRLNEDFISDKFYDENGLPITSAPATIIDKFMKITGIRERRYVDDHLNASDIAFEAGREAIVDSGIDPESLDQIIIAHNFGDVTHQSLQSQNVPSLASRVKHLLGIRNPSCIGYDILFGCPGWVQSLIQSHAYFKAGMAKRVLLIGTETLSRVIDPFDRDSMIFADGAGACVLEYTETGQETTGILGVCVQTHSIDEAFYINMGQSYGPSDTNGTLYIKMKGRKVYEYALTHVPLAMKQCLDEAGIDIGALKKIFLHQANEKMDEEILKRFYHLYGIASHPPDIMPMSIQWLGNSSVATVPTLYHMVIKGEMKEHQLKKGDVVLFASIGAGMNINAVCYRI
jgi:3-oxoacyl-[acyl-carrier-protein] synthase-3